jgi:hypothetical protein
MEVRKRLTEYRARKGLTERDIVEEAIRQYLDGTSDSAKVLAQLERLAVAIDAERERREGAHREVHRAIEVLSEAFGRFVRLWMFVHAATFKLPATQEAAESTVRASAPSEAWNLRSPEQRSPIGRVQDGRAARGTRWHARLRESPAYFDKS